VDPDVVGGDGPGDPVARTGVGVAMTPLLTNEVAKRLGVAAATVRLMEKTGRIVAMRTAGGVRLFDPAEVEREARQRQAKKLGAQ